MTEPAYHDTIGYLSWEQFNRLEWAVPSRRRSRGAVSRAMATTPRTFPFSHVGTILEPARTGIEQNSEGNCSE